MATGNEEIAFIKESKVVQMRRSEKRKAAQDPGTRKVSRQMSILDALEQQTLKVTKAVPKKKKGPRQAQLPFLKKREIWAIQKKRKEMEVIEQELIDKDAVYRNKLMNYINRMPICTHCGKDFLPGTSEREVSKHVESCNMKKD